MRDFAKQSWANGVFFEAVIAESSDIPARLALMMRVSDCFSGLDIMEYTEMLKKNIAQETALHVKSGGQIDGCSVVFARSPPVSFFGDESRFPSVQSSFGIDKKDADADVEG